ncbi:MAG: hypothetical protein QOD06_3238 [Candidatus Binatota bacterium]|nr:hypothetical protein [Candidatus Binatota bacterium]
MSGQDLVFRPVPEGSTGVFVLGMHRGGTSAVTRVINLLGVPICDPADLMPATADNPRGYWESTSLSRVNDDLLLRLGGTWAAPPKLAAGWELDRRLGSFRESAVAAFRAVHPADAWVWKDPRTSITFPFWLRALAARPIVVLAHRHPLEIARSLEKRDGLGKLFGMALWERYLRSALESIAGLPVLLVPYDRFVGDPLSWTAELRTFLARHGLARGGEPSAEEISEFVEPRLRHTAYGEAELAGDREISDAQRALFAGLEARVGGNDAFAPVELPAETFWTEPLLAARRDADVREATLRPVQDVVASLQEDRSRLERTVISLLRWVPSPEGATQPPSVRPELSPVYGPDAENDDVRYARWLERRALHAEEDRRRLAQALEALPAELVVSLVVDAAPARAPFLARLVSSLGAQMFSRWELCATAPADGAACAVLEAAARDPRIRIAATGSPPAAALALARGAIVCFSSAEDELAPEALAEIAFASASDPEADLLYADDDRIDAEGRRSAPFFKPDWSPDYLLSQMYLGGFLAIRRSALEGVGTLPAELGAAGLYDLALRASEIARRIVHLPKILCHRRDRTIDDGAARTALTAALGRRGEEATVEDGLLPHTFRVRRPLRSSPRVTIVVPFRDRADLTRRCIDSIHRRSGYERWEALLVDNGSWEPETRALVAHLAEDPKIRVLREPGPFNWAAINNLAAEQSDGEVLLFLNNDVEARTDGWLVALLEHAQRPEVGAVGARLLYGDGRVQHAGVLVGLGAVAGHSLRFCPGGDAGYFGIGKVIRNYSAVTGACLMVRRDVFESLGGFDPVFAVAYNDVDFCLRLRERGYLIVYTPFAELVHYEAVSRGVSKDAVETPLMIHRWVHRFEGDPYYNPNLSRRREDFTLPVDDDDEVPLWKELRSTLAD